MQQSSHGGTGAIYVKFIVRVRLKIREMMFHNFSACILETLYHQFRMQILLLL